MQTRRLRLGDVVDDYCPRERRLSNHVIVAMVDDTIKQTRCSTCDFEHPYKEAKVPPRRKKKDAPSALFQQVLENVAPERPPAQLAAEPPATPTAAAATPAPAPPVVRIAPAPAARGVLRPNGQAGRDADQDEAESSAGERPVTTPSPRAARAAAAGASAAPAAANANADANANPDADADATEAAGNHEEEAPLHRRPLIRATLPRPLGEVPVRQPPSFTIREAAAARPNKFRYKARPQGAGARQGRPQGAGGSGNQARPGGGRGPQARGAGKKGGAHQPHQSHRAGGHQSARGPKGPHGNKRFK